MYFNITVIIYIYLKSILNMFKQLKMISVNLYS